MRALTIAAICASCAIAGVTPPAVANAQGGGQQSLYDRLGGRTAISAVVDDFVGNVANDKRINKFFAHADIPHLKMELVDQLCQATGGPCTYTGKDMKTAHRGMGIRNRDFNALVQDLGKSLKNFRVAKRDQAQIVAVLSPLRKDIVEAK